jgi:DNA-binding CsgD family transcriptional regulator
MVSELIELSTVIGDIYDAAVDPTLWQRALASICEYVGGHSAVLLWHDPAMESSEALHLFNDDPVYTRLYFEKYLPMNPMFPAAAFVDAGVVTTDDDILPRAELEETRFYKEWIKPQGILGALAVNLEKGMTRTAMINIPVKQPFREEMRDRLNLLVPHLQRAVAIGKLFDQSKATARELTETLDHLKAAVFLVAADANITFANDIARKMLAEAVMVRPTNNRLLAVAPGANRLLQEAVAAAAKGDASVGVRGVAVPLTERSEDRWFAHVLPLTSGRRQHAGSASRAAAAIFIRNTAPNELPPLERFAKLNGLTASEIRVAEAVLRITGNEAIAEALGIAPATVRTHLNHIYRKSGAKNQSGLIKLIAGLGR